MSCRLQFLFHCLGSSVLSAPLLLLLQILDMLSSTSGQPIIRDRQIWRPLERRFRRSPSAPAIMSGSDSILDLLISDAVGPGIRAHQFDGWNIHFILDAWLRPTFPTHARGGRVIQYGPQLHAEDPCLEVEMFLGQMRINRTPGRMPSQASSSGDAFAAAGAQRNRMREAEDHMASMAR